MGKKRTTYIKKKYLEKRYIQNENIYEVEISIYNKKII